MIFKWSSDLEILYLHSRRRPPATCRTSRRDSLRLLTFRPWLTFFTLFILRQRTWGRAGGNALAMDHTPRQRYRYIYHHPHSSNIDHHLRVQSACITLTPWIYVSVILSFVPEFALRQFESFLRIFTHFPEVPIPTFLLASNRNSLPWT